MFKRAAKASEVTLSGEAFGVGFRLTSESEQMLGELLRWLPPAWHERDSADDDLEVTLSSSGPGAYELRFGPQRVRHGPAESVLDEFQQIARLHIATHAPHHVFIHAGAVAYEGRGILVPGLSFSGKTTLTAALVRAGAAYCSDECAVLDSEGRVVPYPKPLALRLVDGDHNQTNHAVEQLGGEAATGPAEVGLVVLAQYRPGASWEPVELSKAETIVRLLEHAYQLREHEARTLSVIHAAAAGAAGLQGERGDATPIAPALLSLLTQSPQQTRRDSDGR